MIDLVAQGNQPDFNWGNLVYLALLALGGLTELIRRWAGKKNDDTVDAEIEDESAPSRPVARPPTTARAAPAPTRPGERAAPPIAPQRPQSPRPAPKRPLAPVTTARPVRPGQPAPQFRTPQTRPAQTAYTSQSVRPASPYQAPAPGPIRPSADAVSPVRTPAAPAISTVVARLTADRTSLQQAVILAEILAPPVALRQQGVGMHFGPSWD